MIEQLNGLSQIGFWFFSALIILGALGVVFHRSIVYSAMFLLTGFIAIAGVFGLLNAPFLAAAQVLVYGVGLTIVMIFGIMLTGDKPFRDLVGQERPQRFWIIPAVSMIALTGVLLGCILRPNLVNQTISGMFPAISSHQFLDSVIVLPGAQAIIADGGISYIALLLFTKYLIPFELVSILLLLAMIGSILLAKRLYPEEEGKPSLQPQSVQNLEHSQEASSRQGESDHATDISLHTEQVTKERETTGVH